MTKCESRRSDRKPEENTNMISATAKTFTNIGKPGSKLQVSSRSQPDSSIRTAIAEGKDVHILHESGKLIQSLAFPSNVQQVLWHTFCKTRNDSNVVSDSTFLCVVADRSIYFYSAQSGYPHYLTYSAPFKVGRIYSTPIRLLVECEPDESLLEDFEDEGIELPSPPKCILYSLSHPMADLRAVIRKKETHSNWDFLISSNSERISVIGTAGEYIILYDGMKKHFMINKIVDTADETIGTQIRTGIMHSTPLSQHNNSRYQQGIGSLSRAVLTRSLLRNAGESFPSPALSYISSWTSHHSPLSGAQSVLSNYDSWCSLRAVNSFSQLLDTPKRLHPTSFAELDPENALLIAEVALEYCWTDPTRREFSIKSNKTGMIETFYMFHSHLASRSFLNVFVPQSSHLLVYDLPSSSSASTGNVTTIPCQNAIFIEKDERTLVVELDRTTFSLYAGPHKIAVIILQMSSFETSLGSLQFYPFAKDFVLLAVEHSNNLLAVKLNLSSPNSLAWRLVTAICNALPAEKNQQFIATYLHTNSALSNGSQGHNQQGSEPALLQTVLFILRQSGLTFDHLQSQLSTSSSRSHSDTAVEHMDVQMCKEQDKEDGGSGPKQRRPRLNPEEKWERLMGFVSTAPSTNSTKCLPKSKSTSPMPGYSPKQQQPAMQSLLVHAAMNQNQPIALTVDKAAQFYDCLPVILMTLSNQLQEWYLSIPLHATAALIVPYLHALASILKADVYLNLLQKDFPRCATLNYRVNFIGQSASPPNPLTFYQPFSLWDTLINLVNPKGNLAQLPTGLESQNINSLIIVISVGLGHVLALLDVVNLLGANWARRLGLNRSATISFSRVIFNKNTTNPTKVNELIRLFGWTQQRIDLLPVCLQMLLNMMTRENIGKTAEAEKAKKRTRLTKMEWSSVSRIRWSDLRLSNVEGMLQITKPILLTMDQIKSCRRSDDVEPTLESVITSTIVRYLSIPLSHAAFYLHTEMPSPMEALDITRVNYYGSALHSGMNRQATVSESIKEWAEFNCGVAAALRIASSKVIQVPDEWIQMVQHKVSGPTAAGILCGLGLNGHFVRLNAYKVPDLLTMGEHKKLFGVGITLGYGGSYLGTADEKAYRVLLIELSMLMGTHHQDVGSDGLVQCSAMAALGLLFAQTGHSFLAQRIVNEIARSPNGDDESHDERAAYKLCSGIALGLICLGKGDSAVRNACPFKQSIPSIADRLIMMMKGGPRSLCTVSPIFLSASEFYQMSTQPNSQPAVSNLVWEGDNVNLHLTAHPATLAIGLIYMQTNDVRMARHVELPNTIKELEQIRPDVIWIRCLAKNIIMWNEIKPTREWVESQIPTVVLDYMKASMKWTAESFADDKIAMMSAEEYGYWDDVVDRKTLAEVYLYGIAGACFAIGLKYAGMGIGIEDSEMNTILETLNFYLEMCMPTQSSILLERLRHFAGPDVMATCSEILVTSMAMIQAGNGDLESVRICRLLRTMESFHRWADVSR
ncbi:hypothetical protein WR25_25380 isoform B [Diploscapter pachys]|nr:hypothetical protein WR25_25380 isoform B [Diploscapter pachys]